MGRIKFTKTHAVLLLLFQFVFSLFRNELNHFFLTKNSINFNNIYKSFQHSRQNFFQLLHAPSFCRDVRDTDGPFTKWHQSRGWNGFDGVALREKHERNLSEHFLRMWHSWRFRWNRTSWPRISLVSHNKSCDQGNPADNNIMERKMKEKNSPD